jgi:hypothetical protein
MEYSQATFTFFQGGITNISKGQDVTLEFALDYIRTGKEYDLLRQVRAEKDEDKRKQLKKGLSYFLFSGTFAKREAKGLIEHSGLICLDFDHVEQMDALRVQLQTDPHIVALFISPSGDGIKVLIPIQGSQHKESFLALETYFKDTYKLQVDKSGKDVSRACFVSYDDNLYYNPEAKLFTLSVEHVDEETGELTIVPRAKAPKQYQYRDPLAHLELVVSRIEDARLDLTTTYDDWQLLAFSMATYGNSGREYFHRLSQFNSGYNAKEADAKFDNAKDSTRFTSPAWFFRKAKDAGIDVTFPREAQESAAPAVKKTVKAPKASTKPPANLEDRDTDINWPNYIHFETTEEEEEAERSVRNHSFFQFKNRIFTARYKDNEITFGRSVSNFSIHPYYEVTDEEGNASRIVEFLNVRGQKLLARVPSDAFTSVNEFSKFCFRGNFHHALKNPEFVNLRGKIFDECKPAKEITTLGQHDEGFYSFANGIFADGKFLPINKNGIVEYRDVLYFLPALSSIYIDRKKQFQFERTFQYVERKSVSFTNWAELFCKVYGDNGKIGMMFYVMALFSDLIFKVEGSFPMLFLYGKPASGKTTMAISLLSMFHPTGDKTTGANINNVSLPALFRLLAQVRNGLVLIEEYQNDLEKIRVENLKSIWNRQPPSKTDTTQSNTSNRTVQTNPESAAVITGQQLPNQDVALFTRCWVLYFFKITDYTQEQRDVYRQLKEMQSHSLTQITTRILAHRSLMEDHFAEAYHKERGNFSGIFPGSNQSRIGQHCAMMMATYNVLSEVLKLPFTEKELRDVVLKSATEQAGTMQVSEESNTFWEIVQTLVFTKQIEEDKDYTFRQLTSITARPLGEKEEMAIKFEDSTEVLFLRLNSVHAAYMKEMRMQGRKGAMDKASLEQYLQNSTQYIGWKRQFRFPDQAPTSVFVFNYTVLQEMFSFRKVVGGGGTTDAELLAPVVDGKIDTALKKGDDDLPF